MDLIIRNDLFCFFISRVEPDGADSGIDPALNVRSQAVTDNNGGFFPEMRNPGKAAVEIFNSGFVIPQFFGDKDIFEIMTDTGTFQPSLLYT